MEKTIENGLKPQKNPNISLYEAFCEGATVGGDKSPALIFMNAKYSYGKVKRETDALARALKNFGVKRGDVITVALPNVPQAVYCLYGGNAVGAVVYLVHALSSEDQIAEMTEKTGSKILFALDTFAEKYEKLCKDRGIKLISCNPTDGLNFVVRAAYKAQNKPRLAYAEDYAAFVRKNSAGECDSPSDYERLAPKDTAVLLNSGGTSGIPKTVELSAFALNALAGNGYELLDTNNVVGEYMLSALPYFHGFGLCMGLHAMIWHGGCNVMLPKFKRKTAAAYVRKGKINYMIGVPALYNAMLTHKLFNGKCLKNIKVGFVGGDFIPQTLLEAFDERMKKFGSKARLFEGYGLTETVTVACVNTHKNNKSQTVGCAVGGVEIKSLKTDTVKDFVSADGEDCGELCIRGLTLMNGYYKDPEATEKTFFTDSDGVRWLKSGDYGFVDSDGYVHFKQRLKRIIKVSGVSVFPAEIEQAVSRADGVNQVCAHDVPDDKKGTAIRLVIETSRADLEKMREEVESIVENKLSRDCRPREIVFTKKLPLTKMNKIDIETLKTLSSAELSNRE